MQYILRIESLKNLGLTMAYGGVFVLPFVIGVITAYVAEKEKPRSILFHIFFSWIPTICSMVFAMIVGWEGSICIVIGLPIYLVFASLGGITVEIWFHFFPNNKVNLFAASALLSFPLVSGYFESYWELPNEIRFVETKIVIEATPEKIWKNIIRIPELEKTEDGFFYRMGFPRPIEATLSREGVGGVREAKFEKGLVFYETITQWERDRKLQFEIGVDPNLTPLTTLDPHVVPGGAYFDALQGEYELEYNEIINNGKKQPIVLHLRSKYRLSTRFNFYASLWGDFLMRDIQNSILRILKKRIEAAG
ncbi:hypothetical protein LEP1GSC133_2416 [Leptospira borgpetersenii serovar Pomona str. 200901868]|uniref:Uncharacterized protein n=1 Tax=Leptospira borgpetersenii serovar Pomona str. 200901868 TaxID=1192866 RepID=M6VZ23_LEPBO|nr:hypothetical protein LEP1GSC133_2416 [Leptospira borgpetersenii serovar Pomona str. 200901868]